MGRAGRSADVVVIGAGVLGAACAYFLARKGFAVHVIERGAIAAGSSSAGEGNLLVSDKVPGHELELALYSRALWNGELAQYGELWEFEPKGGLVVAASAVAGKALLALAAEQRQGGVDARDVDPDAIQDYEPQIRAGLAAAVHYPQDAQVQPMLLTAHLLKLARAAGARVSTGVSVFGFELEASSVGRRIVAVRTSRGPVACEQVINAAGPWAGEIARMAGVDLPILPRRGFVLVTEPLAAIINHKVYAGEYVASTQSESPGLEVSAVIEGTKAGTILIGSSREQVGFERSVSLPALRAIAAAALDLFPSLAGVSLLRSYAGFRPYSPDHLPVIGPDAHIEGLWHTAGHEGAGIGLSVGTAKLISQALADESTDLDLAPFAPARFQAVAPL
jgi:sarcosine oxidase subunit beta